MATTSIWEIESNLNRVIDYDVDKEKTELTKSNYYKDLMKSYEYVINKDKTEEQFFVTGLNCTVENAYKEMVAVKEKFKKTDKVLGYHGYQSFVKGEVTPELAHEIGIKLAEELWADRFEVIVSTHLNTNCIHNHFLLNSVSFVDGKKLSLDRKKMAMMRATSDEICEEYKLSVLPEKTCPKSKINFQNYLKSKYRNSSYYKTTKEDIDRAIYQAYSYKDFENLLKIYGYTLTYRADKLSVCRSGYKRNIRIERAYGEDYSIDNIKSRIQTENMTRVPFQEVYARKKYKSNKPLIQVKKINKKYRSSLYRLYLYYRYKLNSYRKKEYRKPLTEEQRKATQQMDKYSEEAKFLYSRNIHTVEELSLYKNKTLEEWDLTEEKIIKLNTEIRVSKEDTQNLYEEKQVLFHKKNFLKREVEMCRNIENRIAEIKQNVKECEEVKEREKNEHIK